MAQSEMRLERTFQERNLAGKKTLVAYLCVGDPSVEESVDLALACVAAGADVLELGVPFSDPTADGPAIARASQRAIAAGSGLGATLRAAKAIRAKTNAPLVLFGYYNPLFVRGEERAVDDAADAGVDALLVVDLPLGEGRALRERAKEKNIAVVPLLTPTSSEERVAQARDGSKVYPAGFIYYVSVTGVTGSAAAPLDDASRAAASLRERIGLPAVVGFGIDSAEKARAAAAHADGIVVGTALVRRIEEGATPEARKTAVVSLIRTLREALDGDPLEAADLSRRGAQGRT
ncbi:tryptophan synthase subunit alpha [Pendulispora albinea]|uniref:Tryptophan synthase alpha chain n=1 Tax=Pendulispora albinea TaxID=2741071 RepID=A0ABZ2LLZ1_9BACT